MEKTILLFVNGIITYIKIQKKIEVMQLINVLSINAGYKANIQRLIVFLYQQQITRK